MNSRKKTLILIINSVIFSLFLVFSLVFFPNFYVVNGILTTLIVPWLFYFFDLSLGGIYSLKHYFYVLLLLFLGAFLNPLFFLLEYYDKFLHLFTPLIWCSLIFVILDRTRISFFRKLFFTLVLFMSIMAFHELVEYILDSAFDLRLQGVYAGSFSFEKMIEIESIEVDTFRDLILDFIGGILFAAFKIISYFRIKAGFINKKLL